MNKRVWAWGLVSALALGAAAFAQPGQQRARANGGVCVVTGLPVQAGQQVRARTQAQGAGVLATGGRQWRRGGANTPGQGGPCVGGPNGGPRATR
ncbi:MAG: hypothetical protein QHJ73_04485 [Armatimonadota bacterium]|nr:hypothetical protein [Armatimonadota bacterium]